MRHTVIDTLLGIVLSVSYCAGLHASSPSVDPRLFDARLAPVNALLSEPSSQARAERIAAELVRLYGTRDPETQRLVLFWVGTNASALGGSDVAGEMFRRVAAEDPDGEVTRSLKRTLAIEAVRDGSRDARAVVYGDAIRNGMAPVGGSGATLSREEALYLAAQDGIQELRPYIAQYSTLVNSHPNTWGCRNSEMLDVLMEMRQGGDSRSDAIALHAERLATMTPESLSSRLATERGFAMATESLVLEICPNAAEEKRCGRVGEALGRAKARAAVGEGDRRAAMPGDAGLAWTRLEAGLSADARQRFRKESMQAVRE